MQTLLSQDICSFSYSHSNIFIFSVTWIIYTDKLNCSTPHLKHISQNLFFYINIHNYLLLLSFSTLFHVDTFSTTVFTYLLHKDPIGSFGPYFQHHSAVLTVLSILKHNVTFFLLLLSYYCLSLSKSSNGHYSFIRTLKIVALVFFSLNLSYKTK